jgi:putative addiction module killer protein
VTKILLSDSFRRWLRDLRDTRGKARVAARLRSAGHGHFGDVQPVGDGVMEMRIHYGPGYRLYYARRGESVYLLLVGGDKASQNRDIQRAKAMAAELDRKAT